MIKLGHLFLIIAFIVCVASCISYESKTPRETVVRETTVAPAGTEVVTVLPHGYRTRVVRGTTYYYYNNVYYRTDPRGYVVVPAP